VRCVDCQRAQHGFLVDLDYPCLANDAGHPLLIEQHDIGIIVQFYVTDVGENRIQHLFQIEGAVERGGGVTQRLGQDALFVFGFLGALALADIANQQYEMGICGVRIALGGHRKLKPVRAVGQVEQIGRAVLRAEGGSSYGGIDDAHCIFWQNLPHGFSQELLWRHVM